MDEDMTTLLGRLELYKGAWALDVGGSLYVFPQNTTRSEVEKVLQMALNMKKGN